MILVLLSLAAGTSARTGGLLQNVLGAEITVVNGTTPSFPGGGSGSGGGLGGGGGFGGGGRGGGFGGIFGTGNTIAESLVGSIGNITGVYADSPQLSTTGYVDGNAVFIYGIDPSTYAEAATGLNIVSGGNLSSTSSGNQVILADALATDLDVTVGSTVTVGANSTGGSSYQVVGIYDPGTTFGAGTRSAYVSLQNAQGLGNETGKVTEIYVKANEPSEVSLLSTEISSIVPDIRTITSSGITGTASALSGTLSTFYTLIGVVALIAGGFGVINTMMMSISERTREIGTMRAMGASSRRVMQGFLIEALLIGVIGGVVGLVAGGAVTLVLPAFSGGSSSAGGAAGGFFTGAITPLLTLHNLALSFALGALVGGVAGIYPSWRASRMDPVEALRHV